MNNLEPRIEIDKDESLYSSLLNDFSISPKWNQNQINNQYKTKNNNYISHQKHNAENIAISINYYIDRLLLKIFLKKINSSYKTFNILDIILFFIKKIKKFSIVLELPHQQKKYFYIDKLEGIPFLNEENALQYIIKKYMKYFFKKKLSKELSIKGQFQMIYQCPITKILICPPNYHKSQELIFNHYKKYNIKNSFNNFKEQLLIIKNKSAINKYIKNIEIKKEYIFLYKNERQSFSSYYLACKFFIQKFSHIFLYKVKSFCISSILINKISYLKLKTFIDLILENQIKNPLQLSKNISLFLKHYNIFIYKNHKNNNSEIFASQIKRKSIHNKIIFSKSIQSLIHFIEKNPLIKVQDVAKFFIQNKNNIILDLQWLISEGFVILYNNNSLLISYSS